MDEWRIYPKARKQLQMQNIPIRIRRKHSIEKDTIYSKNNKEGVKIKIRAIKPDNFEYPRTFKVTSGGEIVIPVSMQKKLKKQEEVLFQFLRKVNLR